MLDCAIIYILLIIELNWDISTENLYSVHVGDVRVVGDCDVLEVRLGLA